ncbi:MAG: hypothetical protein JXB14_04720 [Candidatus Altiarchaeota archaeon]|nr:hypothetical protein [Candidatus Altiarchaeota archaeon]
MPVKAIRVGKTEKTQRVLEGLFKLFEKEKLSLPEAVYVAQVINRVVDKRLKDTKSKVVIRPKESPKPQKSKKTKKK